MTGLRLPIFSLSFFAQFKDFWQKFGLTLILGVMALFGIIGGGILIVRTGYQLPPSEPVSPPSVSPYEYVIAAEGIIEAFQNTVELGTSVSGIVTDVHVQPGDYVPRGTPLFTIDQRTAKASVSTKKAAVDAAVANAKISQASLKAAQDKLRLAERVVDRRALSEDEYLARKNAVLSAQAGYDAAVENVAVTQADLRSAETALELLTIRAPMDARILQINVHPGEFAAQSATTADYVATSQSTPIMLLGATGPWQIRVNIDENEAWRFKRGLKAVAYLRGNSAIKLPLTFRRVEPQVVPKTSLTGTSAERVDTRVLQVLYTFDPKDLPIYIGQQMDVFIEVSE